ncbi:vWA domain-containing protein [Niabella aurantiaca]|uniref:vWA domain-containing protein n=1 Tax=Niabella aurantiaca TaxID=379900 RepID=UPI0003630BD7|nr:VWA domain-containing protein [Niabella aurantiaca]
MNTLLKLLLPAITFLVFTGCEKENTGMDAMPLFGDPFAFSDLPEFEKYKDYEENPFIKAADHPLSTFSVDADGASYSNMRRFTHMGQLPPKASVRIEEYINYFTYNYHEPDGNENVAINAETATCPWNAAHHLIRIGMKGQTISEAALPGSNYVFLIDVSGSMNSYDKLAVLKSGFKLMADGLKDKDKVAIVIYAGSAGVLLQSTPGSEKEKIKKAIDQLGAGGSTAGAAGISTAYEIAQKNFIEDGNNRVILGTDGDFNIGVTNSDELIKMIETKRKSGIYLTVLGVGSGNLNDHMMEQLANKGNGNYEYIDNAKQIQKVFSFETSRFYTVATDSKIQIIFNPARVESYRLIGYENRALKDGDFEDEKTDAGEIGSGQTITALYEVVLKEAVVNEKFAEFNFKYKVPGNGDSRSLQLEIKTPPVPIAAASENMRFATAVTGWGLLMKQSAYKGSLNKRMILELANTAITYDPNGFRKEFTEIVKNAGL